MYTILKILRITKGDTIVSPEQLKQLKDIEDIQVEFSHKGEHGDVYIINSILGTFSNGNLMLEELGEIIVGGI